MLTISSSFWSWLITSNFSSILNVFHLCFTWIALSDVDLCFSPILLSKANTVEGGTTSATRLYHQCNQSLHMIDGMTVASLSASLKNKASVARDRLW